MKLACEFLIVVLLAEAKVYSWSIAFSRFYQSLVLQLSTKFLSSSIIFRSMGFETDVVLLLNVF